MNPSPRLLKSAAAASLVLSIAAGAHAAIAPPDGARTMVRQAVAAIEAQGPTAAYRALNSGSLFSSRDSWVAILDLQGRVLAHSGNPALVGRDVTALVQPGCFEIGRMVAAARARVADTASKSCLTLDPVSREYITETAYVERVGNATLALSVAVEAPAATPVADISEGW